MRTDIWQRASCTQPESLSREAEEALLPSAKAHCLHLGDFLSEPLGAVSSQLEGRGRDVRHFWHDTRQ